MRGKQAKKRQIQPDTLYGNRIVARMINKIMLGGKKTTAERIVYTALDKLSKETKASPVESLEKSLSNVMPEVEVRSRRIGGANYQIPVPVSDDRKVALAIRWVVDSARKRKGSDMASFLSDELLSAFKNNGTAVKKKEEVHRMAEANRAFSHFAG